MGYWMYSKIEGPLARSIVLTDCGSNPSREALLVWSIGLIDCANNTSFEGFPARSIGLIDCGSNTRLEGLLARSIGLILGRNNPTIVNWGDHTWDAPSNVQDTFY